MFSCCTAIPSHGGEAAVGAVVKRWSKPRDEAVPLEERKLTVSTHDEVTTVGGSMTDVLGGHKLSEPSSVEGDESGAPARQPKKQSELGEELLLTEEELEDERSRQAFVEFARQRCSADALKLFDSISAYVELGRAKRREEMAELGRRIIAEHIVDGAPELVDVGYEVRQRILAAEKSGEFRTRTFDAARTVAFELLKSLNHEARVSLSQAKTSQIRRYLTRQNLEMMRARESTAGSALFEGLTEKVSKAIRESASDYPEIN